MPAALDVFHQADPAVAPLGTSPLHSVLHPYLHGPPAALHEKAPIMANHITALSNTTFDEEIGAADEPVLVDFWAEWCGPCKMIAPILDEIAVEHQGKLRIAKLNVDENPDIALRYGVQSIPTMIVFKDGAPDKTLIGARGKGQILQELSDYL